MFTEIRLTPHNKMKADASTQFYITNMSVVLLHKVEVVMVNMKGFLGNTY